MIEKKTLGFSRKHNLQKTCVLDGLGCFHDSTVEKYDGMILSIFQQIIIYLHG